MNQSRCYSSSYKACIELVSFILGSEFKRSGMSLKMFKLVRWRLHLVHTFRLKPAHAVTVARHGDVIKHARYLASPWLRWRWQSRDKATVGYIRRPP